MRYCSNCRVKIENDIEKCPLCDMDTVKLDDSFSEGYPYIKSHFTRGLLLKLITFVAAFFLGVSLIVDHLVPTGSPWVFITAAAIIYAWISAINVLRYTPNPASIILCQLFSVGGLVFLIDLLCGFYRWSVNYVIPFLIMGAALAISLMIIIKPMKFRACVIYQLVIAVIGLSAVLLWVCGYSYVEWPVVSAAYFSILCFAATVVFSRRRTHNELKKRFHV